MSLRRFDGWEPAEVHEHQYEDGRLIRTVVTRESEWDEDERAWMLGLALREAAECHRCGGVLAETTDYDFRWIPTPPTVCLKCVALRADEEAHSNADPPRHEGCPAHTQEPQAEEGVIR
jgi:hypothetical protein